jgi:hypothetical protein
LNLFELCVSLRLYRLFQNERALNAHSLVVNIIDIRTMLCYSYTITYFKLKKYHISKIFSEAVFKANIQVDPAVAEAVPAAGTSSLQIWSSDDP